VFNFYLLCGIIFFSRLGAKGKTRKARKGMVAQSSQMIEFLLSKGL
jgi:hypothetical protein